MKKLLLFGMALTLLGSCINQSEQQAKSAGVEIYFEETTHDYGDILLDSDGTYYFEFKNIGEEALIINRVRSTCGCTIPSWPREPIEPGKGDKIAVKYNTALPGIFKKSIIVYSSATNSPVKLNIKGNVVDPVAEKKRAEKTIEMK